MIFFFTAGVLDSWEPHRPCDGETKKEKEKEKTLLGHRSLANRTGSGGVQHVSDIDMSPKMPCWCNLETR